MQKINNNHQHRPYRKVAVYQAADEHYAEFSECQPKHKNTFIYKYIMH